MKKDIQKSKKYLITSALPYISDMKHLGNLVGSMLPADVFARYLRAEGEEVLFICGTDEHGTPVELAAGQAKMDTREYCDKSYEVLHNVCLEYGLSFDHFGRTSCEHNHKLTQSFVHKLLENGFIEEREIDLVYSEEDERFLPDRYIIGLCPRCGYDKARGDQCENCSSILDPVDLISPRSALSGSRKLSIRKSKHLFLKQSALAGELLEWVESQKTWPPIVTSIAKSWLQRGLNDKCITRDLSWGVPVDIDGYEGKVYYVWFDAPIGYISFVQEWVDKDPQNRSFDGWWKNAEDVFYVQFMAKDNIPFHTVMFPATILGLKDNWKLVDYVKGFSWLTYYGGKFSTSQNRGVFMDRALSVYPADYWRYYLIKNAPESSDSSFTWKSFAETVNKDLADVFGNFCNRCIRMIETNFNMKVPFGGENTQLEFDFANKADSLIKEYRAHLRDMEFRKSIDSLRSLWCLANEYFNSCQPWVAIKTDRDRAAVVLRTSLNIIALFSIVSDPVIPFSCKKIRESLGVDLLKEWPDSFVKEDGAIISFMEPNKDFSDIGILFTKIQNEDIVNLEKVFGGCY